MGFIEIIWAIALAVWAILLTSAVALMSEFRNARILFWCSPIPIILADIVWITETTKPWLERIIISGVIGGLALIAVAEGIRWITNKEHAHNQQADGRDTKGRELTNAEKDNKHPLPATPKDSAKVSVSAAPQSQAQKVEKEKPREQIPAPTIIAPGNTGIITQGQSGGTNIVNAAPEAAKQRALSDAQKQAIKAAIENVAPEQLLILVFNSRESQKYANQIGGVLANTKWTLRHLMLGGRPTSHDIIVGWRGEKSESYIALVKGLKDAGIIFKEGEFKSDAGPKISLDVGTFPMNDYQLAVDRVQ